jgi:hypothetical protein
MPFQMPSFSLLKQSLMPQRRRRLATEAMDRLPTRGRRLPKEVNTTTDPHLHITSMVDFVFQFLDPIDDVNASFTTNASQAATLPKYQGETTELVGGKKNASSSCCTLS